LRTVRNKKIALLLVLAMLATMVMVAPASAEGQPIKFANAFKIIDDIDNQTVGWFSIAPDDHKLIDAANWKTYVTIDFSSGAEWRTQPADSAAVTALISGFAGTATKVASDDDSLQFSVTHTAAVDGFSFQPTALDIASGTSGDVTATVTLQALDNNDNQVWTQTGTVVLAKVGDAKATVTAKTAKKISGAGLAVKGADIEVTENEPDVLDIGDTVTLTIATSGVTWVAGVNGQTIGSGTAGLSVLPAVRTDSKTVTFTVNGDSDGIGGKLTVDLDTTGYLDVAPGVSGDIVITVASSDSALKDTDVVVATTGAGSFTVTPKDVTDREGFPGKAGVTIGDLKVEANFAGAWASNGSITFTLKNAKWTAAGGAVAGFTEGSMYGDDRSIWYSVTGAPATEVTFDLPTINLDASASGDIVVVVGGTAGPSGEYVVGKVIPAATVEAAKPAVKVNSLDQAAGDIKITEAKKTAFTVAEDLVITLPNGIYFSKNPKVYLNGDEKTVTWGTSPQGKSVATIPGATLTQDTAKLDVVEIKGVAYDVDSRFAAKDIVVELSGKFLSGTGGSTKTLATVANAVGESANSGAGSFVVGSTTYKKNGVDVTMDVAPYISGGRTFLPMRFVANAMGVSDSNILWDDVAKTVTLIKGDKVVQVKIGSKAMLINGAAITMDVAPEIKGGRTMLPLRFIANAFGATVTWDAATQTAGFSF